MSLVAPPPEAVLRQHEVRVSGEPAWRQHLRLGQALWREERGLAIGSYTPPGEGQTRPLGSRLAMPAAQEQMLNYLTEPIAGVVEAEVAAAASDGKLFSTPRLYDDLLSSQPLCFNLFGELKAEPGYKLASAVTRHLWPHRVREITRIEFEHSPGRDDPTYTGNRSAFDVYLEHTCPDGGHGFIGIEVKYHEDLRGKAAENRPRTKEVAQSSGLFAEDDLPELRKLPLQQVWFDHLLALSILDADASWDTGLFVFLHPVINQRCYQVGSRYERLLRDADSFQRLTLEEFVAVLRLATSAPWVREFHHRYLNHKKTASHSTKAHSP